jgi:hypothetical protein
MYILTGLIVSTWLIASAMFISYVLVPVAMLMACWVLSVAIDKEKGE